jgi:beta-lactamase class C
MIRRTLPGISGAAVLICLCLQAAPLCASSPDQDQVAERFGRFFQEHVAAEDIMGAAYVVASPEGIVSVGTAGHTDATKKHRIDENTIFRIASVSKTFAAGLAGMLVQEGQFGWEDRVVDYLPDFRLKEDSSQVRIQHLLGQSTGLIPHAYDNLIEDGLPLDAIQQRFRELPYICQPGACYSYQNSIFSLIEPIMESTTSQSYAELMEVRIFRPLDMKTASVGYDAFVGNPNRALPHVKSRDRWKTIDVQPNYYRVAPAAGVNASAVDMGKWLVAQLGGQPEVMDPEVIDTLTLPRVKTVRDTRRKYWRELLSEAHYGLGWRIYSLGEHRIAYHSGWVSGYRADIAWSEEQQIGVAVLMNVEGSSINELTTTFWRMAFEQAAPAAGEDARRVAAVSPPYQPAETKASR